MSFDRELKALCDEVQGARSAMVMSFDGISVAGHQAREGDLDTEALFYLAQVHLDLDDRTGAIEALEKAVELDPENPEYAQALATAKVGTQRN